MSDAECSGDSTDPSTMCVLHPAFYIILGGSLLSKVPIDRGMLSEKCIYSVQKAGYSYRNPTPAINALDLFATAEILSRLLLKEH